MLEQAAEESVELAKAFLKKARILRGENPADMSVERADADINEEYTDLLMCAEELKLKYDCEVALRKFKRFNHRWAIKKAGTDG